MVLSGNNHGSFQVRFMIFIAYKHKSLSTIDYSSIKSRSIISTRGRDIWSIKLMCSIEIQHDIRKILHKRLNIKFLTYSETLFNDIILNASTANRRLMIDVKAPRESFNGGIINDLVWITRKYILPSSMTKVTILPQLV